jgi:hypothetical protein
MAKVAKKLRSMGFATRTRLGDKTRTVRSRARSINANLRHRTDDKIALVKESNGELADIAERAARQADAVVRNARRKLRSLGERASGRARAAIAELDKTAALTRRVAAQTRQRLGRPDAARRDAGGLVARRGRSPDRKGTARQTGRVRLQGPDPSTTTPRRATRPRPPCSSLGFSGSNDARDGRHEP